MNYKKESFITTQGKDSLYINYEKYRKFKEK